jgi:uncharacterized protein YjiS (DUF1127 family)
MNTITNADTSLAAAPFPSHGISFTSLLIWWAERRRIATVSRELNQYSNADLADLGLRRSDIGDVARGTFRRG